MSIGISLSALIESFALEGGADLEVGADAAVSGMAQDSRRVEKGDLFVALVGDRFDGRAFAVEAVERGAVAVLSSQPPTEEVAVPWLLSPDPRALVGPIAARVYGQPQRELMIVGVTGTNGKSTVVALVAAVLENCGLPAGIIGSLGYRFGDRSFAGDRTTPEASDLFRMLREMRQAGAAAAAMEISSHALSLGRVGGLELDAGVFTNLTRDHFDFHRDFEDYFSAKRSMFDLLKPGGKSVINVDDAFGRRLAAGLEEIVSYGEGGDVAPVTLELDEKGIRGTLSTPRGKLDLRSRLRGRYNISNLLAAVAVAEALELPPEKTAEAIAGVDPIPGRMEPVDGGQPFPVYIDFSHTDAALEAALTSFREFSRRKIVVVFGCGGDRDPGKRPLMGEVAGRLADLPIVTSDNPRSEDPLAIIGAVEEGLKESGNPYYRVVPDRREAIRRAIAVAGDDWAVLIAGKGNEPVQVIGDERMPFFDREEAEKALEERFGAKNAR